MKNTDDPVNKLVAETLKHFPTLYDYQIEAIEAAVARSRKTLGNLLLMLPTAAGKSFIIAGLAAVLKAIADNTTGKQRRILVLAPGSELVDQNSQKMKDHGFAVSIFCAALGAKEHEEDIIFGSPQSVLNDIETFKQYEFAAVFLDEAHFHPPTVREIITELAKINPNIRVIGTTATPYKLGGGYIYQENTFRGQKPLTDTFARDPFFSELVYEISPHELIERGNIVPPVIGDVADHYDTGLLERSESGAWTSQSEEEVFGEGKGELTNTIISDVIKKSRNRRGVMVFTQNVAHAKQVVRQFPEGSAAMITASTSKPVRRRIIADFKAQISIKYLVNVATLTTGFDAPHVDTIVMLRTTESAALFQQIVGRGIRTYKEGNKKECLLLDYAQNMDRFAPDGDIFSPRIVAAKSTSAAEMKRVEVICPTCEGENAFRPVQVPHGTVMGSDGYIYSEDSDTPMMSENREPIAGHMGTRCTHYHEDEQGRKRRCTQRWSSLECPHCGALNSHHQSQCISCHEALKNSTIKMTQRAVVHADALYAKRIAKVTDLSYIETISRNGNRSLKITYQLEELPFLAMDDEGNLSVKNADAQTITVWASPEIKHPNAVQAWEWFIGFCGSRKTWKLDDLRSGDVAIIPPRFITYQLKPPQKGQSEPRFYDVIAYHADNPQNDTGKEEDREPEMLAG